MRVSVGGSVGVRVGVRGSGSGSVGVSVRVGASGRALTLTLKEAVFAVNLGSLSSATRAAAEQDPERFAARNAFHEARARKLGPTEERLVQLRHHEGLAWAEVASALGVSESTVKRMDREVREVLRRELEAAGYSSDDLDE